MSDAAELRLVGRSPGAIEHEHRCERMRGYGFTIQWNNRDFTWTLTDATRLMPTHMALPGDGAAHCPFCAVRLELPPGTYEYQHCCEAASKQMCTITRAWVNHEWMLTRHSSIGDSCVRLGLGTVFCPFCGGRLHVPEDEDAP